MSQSYGMSAMDGMNVNSMLLNMNIPNGDFSRAVNFEALQTNGLMHGEEETSFMEEEGDISQSSLGELLMTISCLLMTHGWQIFPL